MSNGLQLFPHLTPNLLAQWAGSRIHSPGWLDGYSQRNPRDVNATVAMVQNGHWAPVICHNGSGVMVDEHHLEQRDYLKHAASVGGYVFPDFRGGRQRGLRADAWNLAREYFSRQGFWKLDCVAFTTNTPAHNWIVDCCGFTTVNIRYEAVLNAYGDMADVMVYTQRPEDAEEAAQRAEMAFPEGRW